MNIKECIDLVDNIKPNQYTIKDKVMWLTFVDQLIINEVLKTHEGYDGRYDLFEGYSEDKLSQELIVESPYDRLYPQYLKMKIDSENGEIARYNNSSALFNTYLLEYKRYYNKTHMPINGTMNPKSNCKCSEKAISEAEFEKLKREVYAMLSADVDEVISDDKMYDIVSKYAQNNVQMLKGKDGMNGADGRDGLNGVDGKDGRDGLPGRDGVDGADGRDGVNGRDGKDGTPCYHEWNGTKLIITSANGTTGADLKGEKGDKGAKGDPGRRGNTIFSYALGYGKDVEVGSYKLDLPPDELVNEGIDYGDIIVDTDGGCIFQYVASIGDGEATLPAEGLHCIANPNGEKEDKGDTAGAMVFKGVVSELPETANDGEVYKLVNECYSVPINATDIVDDDDSDMLVFRTDKTSAFYKFISFTKDCMYGDTDRTNYQTVDTYYYPNGKKTYFPWIFSTWHDGEGVIAMPSDETFYKALINGGNMEFSYSDTTYLPDDLKSYSIEIKKTYVYHNGEWVEL